NSEKKFVPVMITPFNLKAKVDFDAVSRLVDFYLASGVKGFFANCLSSEMYSIIEDKAEFTKKIYDTGIQAVILITGHFANVDDDDNVLIRNFEKMFSLTGT